MRLKASESFVILRVVILAVLGLHILDSAWFIVEYDGQYTEGRPAGGEIDVIAVTTNDQFVAQAELKNATGMIFYNLDRVEMSPESESEDEASDELAKYQSLASFSIFALMLIECLSFIGSRTIGAMKILIYLSCLFMLFIAIPFATFGVDFLEIGGQSVSQSTQDQVFVHGTIDERTTSYLTEVTYYSYFSGYDLALVNQTVAEEVRAGENLSAHQDIWIAYEATGSARFGSNLAWLFTIPVFWYLLPIPKPE